MTIRVKCRKCRAQLNVPDSRAGEPASCRRCGHMNRVPRRRSAAADEMDSGYDEDAFDDEDAHPRADDQQTQRLRFAAFQPE